MAQSIIAHITRQLQVHQGHLQANYCHSPFVTIKIQLALEALTVVK